MHTVVLSWFGGSTVWFLPLFWRLARAMLPGGSGLRGPGTIRLWLGFVCVLVASCTLEASLLNLDGVDRVGHALAGLFGHVLGHVGTPLAMLALLAMSLPWLLGFRWTRAAAWADATFGLGLPRLSKPHHEEARGRRSNDVAATAQATHHAGAMTPRSNGRYARPTVWRPQAPTRGKGTSSVAGAGVAAGTAAGAGGPAGATRGEAAAGGAGATTRVPAQQPAAWSQAEPTAPAGWLRAESEAGKPRERTMRENRPGHAGPNAGVAGLATGAAAAASHASQAASHASQAASHAASQAGLSAMGHAAARGAAAAPTMPAAPVRSATAPAQVAATAARSSGGNATRNAPARSAPAQPAGMRHGQQVPGAQATRPPATVGGTTAHRPAPAYARPAPGSPHTEPAPSVRETLRSIEENTARWTTLAGASLARRGQGEPAKVAGDAMGPASVEGDEALVSGAPNAVEPAGDVAGLAADSLPVMDSSQATAASPTHGENAQTQQQSPATASTPPLSTSTAPNDVPPPEVHDGRALHPALPSLPAEIASQPRDPASDTPEPATTPAASALPAASAPSIPPVASAPTASPATQPAPPPTEHHTSAPAAPAFDTPADLPALAAVQSQPPGEQLAAHAFPTALHIAATVTANIPAQDVVAKTSADPAAATREATGPSASGNATGTSHAADPKTSAAIPPWEDAVNDELAAAPPVSSAQHVPSVSTPADGNVTPHAAPRLHVISPGTIDSDIRQTPDTPALSNVVRFPGTPAALTVHSTAHDILEQASTPTAHTLETSVANADANSNADADATTTTTTAADTDTDIQSHPLATPAPSATITDLQSSAVQPANSGNGDSNHSGVRGSDSSGIGDSSSIGITEPTPPTEPTTAPRPLRGHAPTSFEFHAPAASHIELPSLDLLARASNEVEAVSDEKLAETSQLIEQRLQEFKVPVTVVGASAGPVITRFEVEPALGVRGSQIVGLMKDLSRGLGLTSVRVVETIPGKTCMGLELPNAKRQTIRLSEILEAGVYQNSASQLTIALGKDIIGHPVVTDLAKAPHMLVAGTTGSGKSVAINAMIVSLLYKATPEDVRLIMIDPKMLELSVYEGIPHLLAPVVTDMKLAANALNWCVGEMEKRYRLMSAVGVRNLAGFNQKIRDAQAHEKKIGNPFSLTPENPEPLSSLPMIVVVIDELADLMMVAGKKIEELIARLAQKARAAGIHLILATQRPSVDVITGLIKANIPTRVAFQVSSKIDSRTILDQMGAESLLGQGDMLFLPPGTGYPQRVHGAFVADEEVHRIVEHLKQFGEPQYEEGILDGPAGDGAPQDLFGDAPEAEADPLYDEAVAFVVRTRRASISAVQRQLRIGYNRAARLVEQMEAAGLVSSMGINGSREVLAPGPAE